ncbi:MAG: Hsp20 family protein [Bacteroidota bacterium]
MITTTFGKNLGLDIDKFFAATPVPPTYPPYNIIKTDENEWIIEFALAGFNKNHIDVTLHEGVLTVKTDAESIGLAPGQSYIHKGIAERKFARHFKLPEYFEVLRAEMRDGILTITLVRIVPEEKQPKSISID